METFRDNRAGIGKIFFALLFLLKEGADGFAPPRQALRNTRDTSISDVSNNRGGVAVLPCSLLVTSRRRRSGSLSLFEIDADFKPEKMGGNGESNNKKEDEEDPITKFEVGAIVRVATKGLKAYQVSPKAYGSFDPDNKVFVPAPTENRDRATQNLQLPVGLRGVITKIYNDEALSANFPIQVSFVPGEHVDEGFDTPVQFVAHFSPEEIELVVE